MLTQLDGERLADLLRSHAPAERDPMFRLAVLERRERQRFRLRVLTMTAFALAAITVFCMSVGVGASVFMATSAMLLCSAVLASLLVSAPVAADLVKRVSRQATQKSELWLHP